MQEETFDLPPPRKKRFTFQSYEQSLKSVQLPSATAPTAFDDELDENASHFHDRLEALEQLSLAPAFVRFAEQAQRLSESMPLLLLNWRRIAELWIQGMQDSFSAKEQGEAVKPLLELMKAFIHDLRSTILPMYPTLLNTLIPLLQRKIDTSALTELLATLATLFKYVLIPPLSSPSPSTSTSSAPIPPVLSLTWKSLLPALAHVNDETRRMVGQVWGSTLRRMKLEMRDVCSLMMLDSLSGNNPNNDDEGEYEELRDGITWVLVEACQAQNRTFHLCAPKLVDRVLAFYLSGSSSSSSSSASASQLPNSDTNSNTNPISTILTRLLTSLIHHASGPSTFIPISDVLLEALRKEIRIRNQPNIITSVTNPTSGAGNNDNKLAKVLDVLQVPCIVRKGTRMPQEHLLQTLTLLQDLITHSSSLLSSSSSPSFSLSLSRSYASLLVSVLLASELATWMSDGARGCLERVWDVTVEVDKVEGKGETESGREIGLMVAGALAAGNWDGWDALLRGNVLKNIPRLIKSSNENTQLAVLRFLSSPDVSSRVSPSSSSSSSASSKLATQNEAWLKDVKSWASKILSSTASASASHHTRTHAKGKSTTMTVPILRLIPSILGPGTEIKNETMALIDSILLPSPSSLAFSTSANSFSESATQPQPHQHRKQILAQSFHALNRLNACNTEESERDASDERISQWTQRLLLHEDEEGNDDVWLRDGEVMNAFVALVESHFSAHHTTIPSTSAYSSITTLLASLDFAITSSDARIRVGALKLLRLFFRTHAESLGLDTSKPSDSSGQDQAKSKKKKRLQLEPSPSPSTGALSQAEMTIQSQSERKIKEMIDLCLEAENVALDVAGVRERVLRIKKVGAAVVSLSNFDAERVDEDNDIETTKRCVRLGYKWLMSQLKINLRPLWIPTEESLSEILNMYPDLCWGMTFDELKQAAMGQVQSHSSSGDEEEADGDGDGEPEMEENEEKEKIWRCPNATKRRALMRVWMGDPETVLKRDVSELNRPPNRPDFKTYEVSLLNTLARSPSVAEKHSRDFVPFFLSLSSSSASSPVIPHSPETSPRSSISSLPRRRLLPYLTLFSKFTNPKALYLSQTLHALYTFLLSKPEKELQQLALSCLLTWKSPGLRRYDERLRGLLDDGRWRDELSALDIGFFPDDQDIEMVEQVQPTEVRVGGIDPSSRKEVIPVLTRLLYGLMGAKQARKHSGPDRRSAILQALSGLRESEDEMGVFVALMLEPFPASATRPFTDEDVELRGLGENKATVGQMAGYLNLLGQVLKVMGSKTIQFWPRLLSVTMEIVHESQHAIESFPSTDKGDGHDDNESDADAEEAIDDVGRLPLRDSSRLRRIYRTLRQTGLKRITTFFELSSTVLDYTSYVRLAFPSFITPRLARLSTENTQAPSALLELIVQWSVTPQTSLYLVEYDASLLPCVYQCLNGVKVKSSVIAKVFDLISHVLQHSSDDPSIASRLLIPSVGKLLQEMSTMFERIVKAGLKADPLTQRMIDILSGLSVYMSGAQDARRLLGLLHPLLKKSAKIVPEKIKTNLLHVMRHLMPLVPDCKDTSSLVYTQCFDSISSLFQSLRTRNARLELVSAFKSLVSVDPLFLSVSDSVESLNAYSKRRMDEPDFEQRLKAFAELNGGLHERLDVMGWKPIIHNMVFFIHDPEEVALRSSAAETLRLFIGAVKKESVGANDARPPLYELFDRTLYPALRNALKSKAEQVRTDVLGVIAFAVNTLDTHRTLAELRPLLADGDAEANFFNNIHHIQVHRRTRALRRLAEFAIANSIRQTTISDIFVPIVEHFIGGVETLDHHLVNEAITTLGALSSRLAWGAYQALVQRHLASAKEKSGSQKTRVRSLVTVLDHFPFDVSEIVEQEQVSEDQDDPVEADITPAVMDQAMRTKIADVLNSRLLPNLLAFMEQRDDTEDVIRLPVAVGIAHVVQRLPEQTRLPQLEKLIVILSQALRSKSQETRDVVKETLGRITIILGPSLLPETLKQLRAALLRGPQLHILAFVTHSLLVLVTSKEHVDRFNQLDDSVSHIAHIAAEVVFGQSGRDVQSEGFKTTLREVRGSASRGLDTFALVAKYISPKKISSLLAPIRAIMQETEAAKAMQQVDDVLRRIASGLNANHHLTIVDLLALCHTLISQNSRFLQQVIKPKVGKRKKNDFEVQVKREQVSSTESDAYQHNSFRFVTLGLDLFITAYRRGRFDFNDPAVMSRLESLVSPIGNTLYSSNSSVVSLGVRAASSISHCPLQSLPKSLPVYLKRFFVIIRQAGSTESEMIQHTFKSLASIIRDCPDAKIQDDDLTFLLEVIIPDVEEKDRQIAVFALLRAIVSRKFVVPEIYDVMEKVTEIMVTNQSTQIQELCRGVLLQFLLDYPQGKGRLRVQMTFLAKNLSYVFESGRLSVMEILGAIIAKFDHALIQEYSELLFVSLFMVLANDDSAKCREIAAELVKSLYSRADESSKQTTMNRLHVWAAQSESTALRRTVAQVYGLLVEADANAARSVLSYLDALLSDSASALENIEQASGSEDRFEELDSTALDWHLPYHSLTALSKVFKSDPTYLKKESSLRWPSVVHHLLFPHAWVRLAATRLIGLLCSAFPPSIPLANLPSSHPLTHNGIIDLAHKLCAQLRSSHLDEALSMQVVKNLFYVGKCFALWPESKNEKAEDPEEDDDEADEAEEEDGKPKSKAAENPLRWLFSRLSYQARSAHISRRNRKIQSDSSWARQILSVFRWFAAMVSYLATDDVTKFLTHVLAPVYRVLEDDTIRDSQMEELRSTGQELQTLVQEKVGTTLFAAEYSRIRQGVLNVRRDRRTAKAVQVTTAPELAAKRKIQRNATKKASRKRKHQEFTNEKVKLGLKRARFD